MSIPRALAEPQHLTDADAGRILRAWERATESNSWTCPDCGVTERSSLDGHVCPEPRPVATCPVCGLTGIPVCDAGHLAAHGWARGGALSDGPLDANGWPAPSEWSGCANRDPDAVRAPASERWGVRDRARPCPLCGAEAVPYVRRTLAMHPRADRPPDPCRAGNGTLRRARAIRWADQHLGDDP